MAGTIRTSASKLHGIAGNLPIVPLNDLSRQTKAMREEIDRVVADVIGSGRYVLGPQVSAFEGEFASYCGVGHAIGVANGTEAIELALRAVDCRQGGEVVTVANAGMYATASILATGATPVFADINPVTMTMSPESLAKSISSKTVAVIVTHLYGKLADMDRLIEIAKCVKIPLIEDCAQAHGAERDGRKAGAIGAIGCFSFYPTKNIGSLGDGGAVVSNDNRFADAVRQLRQYGWHSKYNADRLYGRNSRLDELQAAVLRIKLPMLAHWNERRRNIMQQYHQAAASPIVVPNVTSADHAAHLCVVRCANRQALRDFLTARNIATDIHYPIPDNRQKALQSLNMGEAALPHTMKAVDEILTIPCFPEMTEVEIERVCSALADFNLEEPKR